MGCSPPLSADKCLRAAAGPSFSRTPGRALCGLVQSGVGLVLTQSRERKTVAAHWYILDTLSDHIHPREFGLATVDLVFFVPPIFIASLNYKSHCTFQRNKLYTTGFYNSCF